MDESSDDDNIIASKSTSKGLIKNTSVSTWTTISCSTREYDHNFMNSFEPQHPFFSILSRYFPLISLTSNGMSLIMTLYPNDSKA